MTILQNYKMAAESSDEEFNDVITSGRNENEEEEDRESCGISTILVFVLCSLFYLYVLICLFLTIVVPASIAPILDHPFDLVGGNHTAVVGGTSMHNYIDNKTSMRLRCMQVTSFFL